MTLRKTLLPRLWTQLVKWQPGSRLRRRWRERNPSLVELIEPNRKPPPPHVDSRLWGSYRSKGLGWGDLPVSAPSRAERGDLPLWCRSTSPLLCPALTGYRCCCTFPYQKELRQLVGIHVSALICPTGLPQPSSLCRIRPRVRIRECCTLRERSGPMGAGLSSPSIPQLLPTPLPPWASGGQTLNGPTSPL